MCEQRRDTVPGRRPILEPPFLVEEPSRESESLLARDGPREAGGRVVREGQPRVIEEPSVPAGPGVDIDGEISSAASLEEALIRARAAMEEDYVVSVYDADGRRYLSYDVCRLTDVLPDGSIVVVGPRQNPWWDEWMRYQYDRYGLSQLSGRKNILAQIYSYAIPEPRAVRFVAAALGERAVELGAGSGYWAAQLARWGTRVDAYDIRPPRGRLIDPAQAFPEWSFKVGYGFSRGVRWYPVREGTPEVLARYGDWPLFLCYPTNHNQMGSECLRHYPGDTLVLVGGPGTPVAQPEFFVELEAWGDKVDEIETYGWQDAVPIGVYKRRGAGRLSVRGEKEY